MCMTLKFSMVILLIMKCNFITTSYIYNNMYHTWISLFSICIKQIELIPQVVMTFCENNPIKLTLFINRK